MYVIKSRYIGAAEVALALTACVSREPKLGGMNVRFPHIRLVVNLRRTKMPVAYRVSIEATGSFELAYRNPPAGYQHRCSWIKSRVKHPRSW